MLNRTTAAKWLSSAYLILVLVACAPPFRVYQASDAYLKRGVPLNMGFAYGRIVVRGWSATARSDYTTSVEFRNRVSGQAFTHRLTSSGEFHWVLLAGRYEITDVWSGFERVSQEGRGQGIYFDIPAGRAVYLGELYIEMPSTHGRGAVSLFDNYDAATHYLRHRYPSLKLETAPEKRLFGTWKSRKVSVAGKEFSP